MTTHTFTFDYEGRFFEMEVDYEKATCSNKYTASDDWSLSDNVEITSLIEIDEFGEEIHSCPEISDQVLLREWEFEKEIMEMRVEEGVWG